MPGSNCCFLTCIQVSQEAGKVVWQSYLLKNFPVCYDPHKGFSIDNEAEVDVFLEYHCFSIIQWMLAIWSLVLLPFLNPACTSGSSVHVLLKPSLKGFEHYFASMWNGCTCEVFWTFFGTALLWDWNENWPFPVLSLRFPQFAGILSAALSQHHLLGFEKALLEFHHLH